MMSDVSEVGRPYVDNECFEDVMLHNGKQAWGTS